MAQSQVATVDFVEAYLADAPARAGYARRVGLHSAIATTDYVEWRRGNVTSGYPSGGSDMATVDYVAARLALGGTPAKPPAPAFTASTPDGPHRGRGPPGRGHQVPGPVAGGGGHRLAGPGRAVVAELRADEPQPRQPLPAAHCGGLALRVERLLRPRHRHHGRAPGGAAPDPRAGDARERFHLRLRTAGDHPLVEAHGDHHRLPHPAPGGHERGLHRGDGERLCPQLQLHRELRHELPGGRAGLRERGLERLGAGNRPAWARAR